jgi:hypothetical protein
VLYLFHNGGRHDYGVEIRYLSKVLGGVKAAQAAVCAAKNDDNVELIKLVAASDFHFHPARYTYPA